LMKIDTRVKPGNDIVRVVTMASQRFLRRRTTMSTRLIS
jgi:hypothetical protein